jgi:hypothetical protein
MEFLPIARTAGTSPQMGSPSYPYPEGHRFKSYARDQINGWSVNLIESPFGAAFAFFAWPMPQSLPPKVALLYRNFPSATKQD